MRMRKVFAGIAALATLLGGLAVGASAAQATPTNLGNAAVTSTPGAITVVNAQEGHTYSAYKIASFSNVKVLDGKVASLDVKTEPKWVDWLNSALTAKKLYVSNYSGNPAARLATLNADDASSVINEIKLTSSVTPNATEKNDAGIPTTLKLKNLTDGWYVISDYYNGNQHGSVALVATTITANGAIYTKFKLNEAENQTNVQDALGVFYAKNENVPDKPKKTVTKDNKPWEGNSVNVGDTLTYTVWSAISENAVNYKNYGYKIMDRASRGLTVNKASIDVVVSDDRDGANPVPLVLDKDYTVEQTVSNGTDGESRGTTTTVISFTGTVAPNHAGKYVKVTYTATVNADAVDAGKYADLNKTDGTLVSPSQAIAAGTLINRAYVKHDNSSWTDPDERTVYTGAFEFQKYGAASADEEGLDGVQFEVYAGKEASGNPLKFTKNGDGSYTYNPQGATTAVTSTTIGDKKGVVSLKGLRGTATSSGQRSTGDTGVYTIKEIQTVNGYTQQILATFSVKLTVDVNSGASSAELLVAAGNNVLGLASQDSTTAGIRVKNVQNVTQLPLTGAAGITLFAVIAVLFAVVAAILIVKFRSARRELEA